MNQEEQKYNIQQMIITIPELEEFLENNNFKDFSKAILMFYQEMEKQNRMSAELDLKLKILLEKIDEYREKSIFNLHHINKSIAIDDRKILNDFFSDYKDLRKDKKLFKKAEKQHYETITEKIAHVQVDFDSILDKYFECNHPYIYSQIALAYNNAKKYHIGFPYLAKALFYTFSSPNIYWENIYGMMGCTDALWEVQHLLGRGGMDNLKIMNSHSILSYLYLCLSRIIYMCDYGKKEDDHTDNIPQNVIHKINYLSMRGDLIYDYRYDFTAIFGTVLNPGINVDIQFMADKYISHEIAEEYGIGIITHQNYLDALKMYRHGSLIPNSSGGCVDIEEVTFGELIKRGLVRSEELANRLYKEYTAGSFKLDTYEIEKIMMALKEKYL